MVYGIRVSDHQKTRMRDAASRILEQNPHCKFIYLYGFIGILVIRSDIETLWIIENVPNIAVDKDDIVRVNFNGKSISYNGAIYHADSKSNAFKHYTCNRHDDGCYASINLIKSAEAGKVLAILMKKEHNHRVVSFIWTCWINSFCLAYSEQLQRRDWSCVYSRGVYGDLQIACFA
jgi:hypothetical protein